MTALHITQTILPIFVFVALLTTFFRLTRILLSRHVHGAKPLPYGDPYLYGTAEAARTGHLFPHAKPTETPTRHSPFGGPRTIRQDPPPPGRALLPPRPTRSAGPAALRYGLVPAHRLAPAPHPPPQPPDPPRQLDHPQHQAQHQHPAHDRHVPAPPSTP